MLTPAAASRQATAAAWPTSPARRAAVSSTGPIAATGPAPAGPLLPLSRLVTGTSSLHPRALARGPGNITGQVPRVISAGIRPAAQPGRVGSLAGMSPCMRISTGGPR